MPAALTATRTLILARRKAVRQLRLIPARRRVVVPAVSEEDAQGAVREVAVEAAADTEK